MRQVSLQLLQSVEFNPPNHAGVSSQVRQLRTEIIKTHTHCVYRQTSIMHWPALMRLSTQTTEYLSDNSAVCIYLYLFVSANHTAALLCLACCCDTVGCWEEKQRGFWTLRRHSRSNIKNDSWNHAPYTPRESVSRVCVCVCVCVCKHVCGSQQDVSSVLFVLNRAGGQYAPPSLSLSLASSICVCVCVCVCERERVWPYLNEIWQWIVTISEGASCRG